MKKILHTIKYQQLRKIFTLLIIFTLSQTVFAKQNPADIKTIKINDITLYALKDSNHTFESMIFSDIDQYPERKNMMPNGQFKALTKTYLVKVADKIVLIDSGLGIESGVEGKTKILLTDLGMPPENVTDILLTHMDIDHISGLIEKNKAVYPKATLHIAKTEYDAWIIRGADREPQYIDLARKVVQLYKERIVLFDYNSTILPSIVAKDARGHTAGHTAYHIKSGNKDITIVGDMLHVAPIQLRFTNYSSIYDVNSSMAAATRTRILTELSKEDTLIAGMHFIEIGKVKAVKGGGYKIDPI